MKLQRLKSIPKYLIFSILFALFLTHFSHAATNVSGNITTNTTWTLANSPYIVTSGMQVFPGVTLTIEPGVTVKFNKDTLLRIGGELIASGTASQMITFTSNEATPAAGDWGSIGFVEGAVGSILDENGEYVSGSIIKYCRIEYGNGVGSAVDLYIRSNMIHNNYNGIFLNSVTAIITGNSIYDNNGFGIYNTFVTYPVTAIITGNSVYSNNYGISLDSVSAATITGNFVYNNNGTGIYVSGAATITGNFVYNNNGTGIYVGASTAIITGNSVYNNNDNGISVGASNATITGNNLQNNSPYAIHNASSIDIPAANNWWGTTDTSEIEAKIFDYYDDFRLGKVIYQPFAQAPFPMTGTAPNAAFIATPLSGNAPLTVAFTDQSTNSPTSWSWNFGDSGTSTSQHPSHTYSAAGTYTVSLIATNAYGSDTETKNGYITVSAVNTPIADFTASPLSGTAPLTVQFTDQSTNTPTSWSWNFGDGETSTEENPSHTYASAGTYTVSLTVSNASGSDAETKTGYIAVTSAGTGTIAGVVSDAFTGIGIGRATISVSPGNYQTVTISFTPFGQIGAYILGGIPAGTYSVSASASDYTTATQSNVVVTAGAVTSLNPSLTPLQVENEIEFGIDSSCGDVGSPITISAHSSVGGHFYKYFVNTVSYCGTSTPSWRVIKDWTTDQSVTYTPSQTGRYTFVVWTTDDITESCPELFGASYGVGDTDCIDATEVSLTPASGVVNEPVTIRAIGASQNLQYSFWVNETSYDCQSHPFQNWVLLQDWSSSNSYTHTPAEEKVYTFVVWTAKDPTTNPCYGMAGMTYKVEAYQGGGEGYWSFNEASGSVAYDSSSYGNDGIIYGANRVTGICGGALHFDGTDDYVEIPDHSSLDMANGITIEAWIKLDEIPTSDYKTISSKDENGEFHINASGKIYAWLKNDLGAVTDLTGQTVLSTNSWYHVSMTCTANGSLKVYVNGTEDGSTSFSGNVMTNSDPFQIGQDQGLSTRFFKGAIDEVRIYNHALTQSEIQEAMECGTGTLTGTVKDSRTGIGIGGVTVTVTPGNYSAITDVSSPFSSAGKYEIEDIPVGTYTVTTSKSGYASNSQSNVMISAGETTTVNITLTPPSLSPQGKREIFDCYGRLRW